MSVIIGTLRSRNVTKSSHRSNYARGEPAVVRWTIISVAVIFLTIFLVIPLVTVFQQAFPKVTAVRADGRSLPFPDDSFDIGFSNAVVEHLPDLESQTAFVGELCRVSRRVFLTTPNRWFPVDTHTLVPLAHWLPDERRDTINRRLRREEGLWLQLLSTSDLLALFPDSVRPRLLRR